jgi:hypothetical protein
VFFDRIGPRWELLTSGRDTGLLRWPVQSEGPAGPCLRLGPPRQLSPLPRADFARSPEGRTLAAVYQPRDPIQVLDVERGVVRQELGVHPQGDGLHALSADGRWVASCGWHSDLVRLWDARSGQMVRQWDHCPRAAVFFTPDSRALVISLEDEVSFWDLESGQRVRRLRREVTGYPGYVAFSPDGRLMALEMAPAVIHLKDVATERTVAKLEDPHGDRAKWIGFTPDGRQLVTVATYAKAIHVWDLGLIRERLQEMGLDWDWPEFSPADPRGQAARPLTVAVVRGDPADPALEREQKARQAIERERRAVAAHPDWPMACNNLAWVYLTAPEPLRDVKAALALAEKAVRLDPQDPGYRNTLGVACYRAGRYRQAVEAMRPNLENQADAGLACDLYFLAMSCHRLGEADRARDYYAWAVRWTRMQPGLSARQLEELDAFRAEAAELLGIDPKKD